MPPRPALARCLAALAGRAWSARHLSHPSCRSPALRSPAAALLPSQTPLNPSAAPSRPLALSSSSSSSSSAASSTHTRPPPPQPQSSQTTANNAEPPLPHDRTPVVHTNAAAAVSTNADAHDGAAATHDAPEAAGRGTVQQRDQQDQQQQQQQPLQPPRQRQEIVLDERDLQEVFIKGGGKGGQKVNKTNSRVQLRHLPTGILVD
ncbi:hypothetical protein HK405_007377, partial [Cladochytrium tenue]